MQTFLPFANFRQTAAVLDRRRLGNQRSEAKVILKTLLGESKGWINHPAVKMWKGYEFALTYYGICICLEWLGRGYKDEQLDWFYRKREYVFRTGKPSWVGDERLHASHRAALLHKDLAWYSQFGWGEPPGINYFWPEGRGIES